MKRLLASLVVAVGVSCSLITTAVSAVSENIVIAQVQTGGAGSGTAAQEFITLFNNAYTDVDITGWCVRVSDYNGAGTNVYCAKAAAGVDEVRMPSKGAMTLVSTSYQMPVGLKITEVFQTSTTMSGARGHVTVLDSTGAVVDRAAWLDYKASPVPTPPKYPEGVSAAAPAGGSMMTRTTINGTYVDTDNNFADFSIVPSAPLTATKLIDYQKPVEVVDLCATIDGVQATMPDGYGYDEAGNCEKVSDDMCSNIDLIQLEIPDGYMQLDANCYAASLDICPNVIGMQLDLPVGYRMLSNKLCKQIQPPHKLIITELLPNVSSVDTGKEFIEIYNNDKVAVDLSDYVLSVGKSAEKSYALPELLLPPQSYIVLKDSDYGFSLLNTTTRVELHYYDDTLIDDVIPYQDPQDDMSWALIDNVWQFTDNISAGAANLSPTPEQVGGSGSNTDASSLEPCPAGKYRNPLTNRCRTIESDAAVLAACDADEYRNPETNRCRKISLASITVAACKEGYERNPETNRCRKVASDAGLAPCDEGYERNPATNRCRKKLSDVATTAVKAAEQTMKTAEQFNMYAFAAVAAVGVAGYGFYEWRTELHQFFRRLFRFIIRK